MPFVSRYTARVAGLSSGSAATSRGGSQYREHASMATAINRCMPVSWRVCAQPRPPKGICVAMIVICGMFTSSGRLAICTMASATWLTAIVASGR